MCMLILPRGPRGPGSPICPAFPLSPFSPEIPSGPVRLKYKKGTIMKLNYSFGASRVSALTLFVQRILLRTIDFLL